MFGELDHHLRARLRPPCLDEAQVACRDAGLKGEIELREASALPPLAEEDADAGAGRGGVHVAHGTQGL